MRPALVGKVRRRIRRSPQRTAAIDSNCWVEGFSTVRYGRSRLVDLEVKGGFRTCCVKSLSTQTPSARSGRGTSGSIPAATRSASAWARHGTRSSVSGSRSRSSTWCLPRFARRSVQRGRTRTQWEVGSSAPAGLVDALLGRGLVRDTDPYAVALVLTREPPAAGQGLVARRVETFEEYRRATLFSGRRSPRRRPRSQRPASSYRSASARR